MNLYNPYIHHRRSIRLKNYDYSQAGLYFITLCVQNKAQIFGKIENKEMIFNPFGKIACHEWAATEQIRNNCKIHEHIIMPNHIHGIIEILFKKEKNKESNNKEEDIRAEKFKSPSQTIGSIIRGFKIATIKKIKDFIQKEENSNKGTGELQFAPMEFAPTTEIIRRLNFKIWQRNYYEHIIRPNNHITLFRNIL